MENHFLKYKNIKSRLMIGKINKDILLSIVIPTYKREELLEECLDSILKQKLDFNYEVIIVDNDDDLNSKSVEKLSLKEKYKKLNLLYYKNEVNLGPTGNWNRCVELASGKWITMIHDDDYFNEKAIEKILNCINKYPTIDMFYFDFTIKNEIENKIYYNKANKTLLLLPEIFIFKLPVAAPLGITFKKSIFMDVGGFNEIYYPSSDWEIISRILKKNKILLVKNTNIITYRISVNDSLNQNTKINFILKDYEITEKLLKEYPIKYIFLKSYLKRRQNGKMKKLNVGLECEYLLRDKIEYFIYNKIFHLKKIMENYYEKLMDKKTEKYLKNNVKEV